MSWRRRPTRDMIGSAQSAQLVNCVILTCHTACHAPPDVTILRMHISSESLFPPFPKRLALRMGKEGALEAWSEVGFLGVPREAIVPQRPPTELLHADLYLYHCFCSRCFLNDSKQISLNNLDACDE